FMRMPLKNAYGSQMKEQTRCQKLSRTERPLTKASRRSNQLRGRCVTRTRALREVSAASTCVEGAADSSATPSVSTFVAGTVLICVLSPNRQTRVIPTVCRRIKYQLLSH